MKRLLPALLTGMVLIAAAPPDSRVVSTLQRFLDRPFIHEAVEDLAGKIPAGKRGEALAALDALNRGSLSAVESTELTSAYAALAPQSPGSNPLVSLSAQRLQAGDYAVAEALSREALRRDPKDLDALAILNSAKGRTRGAEPAAAKPPAPMDPAPSREAPVYTAGRKFAKTAPPPPAPGTARLDPRAPDYWDRQLLGPLLVRSDANPVAKTYLSPLLRDGKVTMRLVTEREDPSIANAWGTYNPETSIIKYNLDLINSDLVRYNAYYAKRSPERVVRVIDSSRPLDAKQIEFLTGRFLPLAVHEAGGHGTHGDQLRRIMGTSRSPISKDTEIMAWRLEAAAVEYEVRRDPKFLTEPTPWAMDESALRRKWLESHSKGDPKILEKYLNRLGYAHLVNVAESDDAKLREISELATMIQSRCRLRREPKCADAYYEALAFVPARAKPGVESAILRYRGEPSNDALRVDLAVSLSNLLILAYRLDPKGAATLRAYYSKQNKEVGKLEGTVAPIGFWSRIKSARGER